MINLKLSEEQDLIKKTAKEFAHTHLNPGVIERDEKSIFPSIQVDSLMLSLNILTPTFKQFAKTCPMFKVMDNPFLRRVSAPRRTSRRHSSDFYSG